VFARFCGPNSLLFAIAEAEIASSNGSFTMARDAYDHERFDSSGGWQNSSFGIASDASDSLSVGSWITSGAQAQAVFARF